MTNHLAAALLAASALGALGAPAHAEPTWTRCSPGGGGAFLTVDVSEAGTALVGSDLSGIYRRSADGEWSRVGSKDGLDATSVEVVRWEPLPAFRTATKAPTDALAGTRNGLYRTGDAGVTWAKVADADVGAMTVTALAWKPDVLYAAGAASSGDAGVLLRKSTDSGRTWSPVKHDIPSTPAHRAVKLAMDARDPNVVWLLSGHDRLAPGAKELWKSADGGRTFARVNGPGGKPFNAIDVATHPSIAGLVLMTAANDPAPGKNDSKGAVYWSADQGKAWTAGTGIGDVTGAVGWDRDGQTAFLVNVQVNACGGPLARRAGRYASANRGATWARVDDGASWDVGWTECPAARGRALRTVARTLSPHGEYWVTAQFVWRYAGSPRPGYENAFSTRVGTKPSSWITRGIDNAVPTAFAAAGTGPGQYFAGYYDIGLWMTRDGGASWVNRNPSLGTWHGFGGNVTGIAALPNGVTLAAMAPSSKTDAERGGGYLYSLWRSTDDGESWSECRNGLPTTGFMYGLSRDPASGRLWLTRDGQVYTSTDAGQSWRLAPGNLPRLGLYATQARDGVVLVGGPGGLYRMSGRDSATWTPVEEGAFDFSGDPGEIGSAIHKVRWHGIQQILFDPYLAKRVWVVSYYKHKGTPRKRVGIWKSDDMGLTFTQISSARLRRGVALDSLGLRLHVTSGAALTAGCNDPAELNAAQGKETWRDDGSGSFRLRSIDTGHPDYRYPFGASVTVVEDGRIFVGVPGYGFMRQDLTPAGMGGSAIGGRR
ncbi:MAG: WD40/YVTN/BNR-like repeat-containing protein [Candidatus Eiseniibacteriota bacterium]